MRVLHAAALLTPPSGILRQMEWEQQAAQELGLVWHVRMYCPAGAEGVESPVCVQSEDVQAVPRSRNGFAKLVRWIKHRRAYAAWIRREASEYDVVLLRYYVHDPFQLMIAWVLDKPLFLVHHTKEVDELASGPGVAGWIRARLEALIGGYCIRAANGSIAMTREILKYERERSGALTLPGLFYPNGIRLSQHVIGDERQETPEFLFVASEFHPWHGLDLVLDALDKSTAPLVLHLVGNLASDDRQRAEMDPRIMLHGHLNGKQIQQLAVRSHVGLSSFALYRKGMSEACTLKVREYLDFGLPVYAGHRDVFPTDFPFYRMGDLDICELLAFASECASVERSAVAELAAPYIDKKILLLKLYNDLVVKVKK